MLELGWLHRSQATETLLLLEGGRVKVEETSNVFPGSAKKSPRRSGGGGGGSGGSGGAGGGAGGSRQEAAQEAAAEEEDGCYPRYPWVASESMCRPPLLLFRWGARVVRWKAPPQGVAADGGAERARGAGIFILEDIRKYSFLGRSYRYIRS